MVQGSLAFWRLAEEAHRWKRGDGASGFTGEQLSQKWAALAMASCAPIVFGGSISGHVTNSVTGAGIAGVTVVACPVGACYGPESRKEALSDNVGVFRIDGIPDGQYGFSTR